METLSKLVTLLLFWFFQLKRSWSSGYDRRLPSDGPGFNSRRTHISFFIFPSSPSWIQGLSAYNSKNCFVTPSLTSCKENVSYESKKEKPDAGLEPATSRLRACHSTD